MSRKWVIGTGALAASALLFGGAPSAMAAADTTAPSLKLPVAAGFVVGTQIGESTGLFGSDPSTYPISQTVSWSATDASGICGYDVFRVFAGMAPQRVVSNSMATTYTDLTTDYDDQQGGGSLKVLRWKIAAHDCAGNTSSATTTVLPVVTQENSSTYGYKGVTISYAGRWNSSICRCWSGSRDQWTSTAGSRATITRTWATGDQVALVTEMAPDRGAFEVLVDGVHRATVDTYAATRSHRSVVWNSRLSAGTHTIIVVNLATPGRERIDLDAVLSNSKFYCNC